MHLMTACEVYEYFTHQPLFHESALWIRPFSPLEIVILYSWSQEALDTGRHLLFRGSILFCRKSLVWYLLWYFQTHTAYNCNSYIFLVKQNHQPRTHIIFQRWHLLCEKLFVTIFSSLIQHEYNDFQDDNVFFVGWCEGCRVIGHWLGLGWVVLVDGGCGGVINVYADRGVDTRQ